jgi:GTP pyrophosphokinase
MKAIGAKVNYKLVPLSHKLNSGDQVEVIMSSKQKPTEDWLDFIVTAKAKSRVKSYLKEGKRKRAEEGRDMLKRRLAHLGVPLSQTNINEIAQHYKMPQQLEFLYAVAVGVLDLKELKDFTIHGEKIYQPGREVKADAKPGSGEEDALKTKPLKEEIVIFGDTADKVKYKLAQCCQPIPGDNVFGFLTSGEGLKIHRTDCPNAARLLANYGHRIIKTKWAKNKEISFLSGVRIIGLDDVGVIQKITNVISGDLKMNMRSLSIDSDDGIFEGRIMVFVHDREELMNLCDRLSALEGINTVERMENPNV